MAFIKFCSLLPREKREMRYDSPSSSDLRHFFLHKPYKLLSFIMSACCQSEGNLACQEKLRLWEASAVSAEITKWWAGGESVLPSLMIIKGDISKKSGWSCEVYTTHSLKETIHYQLGDLDDEKISTNSHFTYKMSLHFYTCW